MEIEKLTERLLEDSPDKWPESVKPFRVPVKPVPAATRERIRGLIRQAVQEEVQQDEVQQDIERPSAADDASDGDKVVPIYKRGWFYAAAAVLPVAIAVGAYLFLRPTDGLMLQTVQVEGKVRHTSGGTTSDLKLNRQLSQGDVLNIPGDGVVAMKTDQGIFQLKGPASVDLTRVAKTDRAELDFNIRKGIISIRSTNHENKRVVWRTATIVATMVGTVARLSVDDEYQNLEVLEGEFRVNIVPTGETVTVKAGEALYLPTKIEAGFKAPPPKKLIDIELDDLKSLNKSLSDLEKGKKAPVKKGAAKERKINQGKIFDNVEQIRAYYGTVYKVVIRGRGTYTGYITKQGNNYIMHAPHNPPVTYPADMVISKIKIE